MKNSHLTLNIYFFRRIQTEGWGIGHNPSPPLTAFLAVKHIIKLFQNSSNRVKS